MAPARALLMVLLLAPGTLVSAGHLGRPVRSPLALKGVGRSPLSHEIWSLGLALTFGLLAWLGPARGPWTVLAGLGAGVSSVAFLLSLAAVYALPGRPGWGGAARVQPLFLGLVWGLALSLGSGGPAGGWQSWGPLLLCLGADTLLTLGPGLRQGGRGGRGEPVHPSFAPLARPVLLLRLLLSGLLAPLLLFFSWADLGLGVLSLALLLDRFGFYAFAQVETTESEVKRVEALLG